MNNYSAEAKTEDVIEFLEGVLSDAAKFHLDESARQQRLIGKVKMDILLFVDDDEHLLRMLQDAGEVNYTMSNYEEWLCAGFWETLFSTKPYDDRVSHIKDIEATTVASGRDEVINLLNKMKTLKKYYSLLDGMSRDRAALGMHYYQYYPTGYKMVYDIIKGNLPPDTYINHMALERYSNDLTNIRGMLESLAVHEFDTITIEEDMLKKVRSVQKITKSKVLT